MRGQGHVLGGNMHSMPSSVVGVFIT